MKRRTIAATQTVEGIGLHLGQACRLTFLPAPSGHGVQFRRVDLEGCPLIRADVDAAVLVERRTQLGKDPVSVHTVEHVLAAVGALEIDDLIIEIDAPEPPIMDGSAAAFFDALTRAGIAEQQGIAATWELSKPVRLVDGDSVYEAYPARALELDVTIEFAHPLVGRQRWSSCVNGKVFGDELARARTFGFTSEFDILTAMGLIRGVSTQNTLVLDEEKLVDNELRWADEFVRHKAMDCVGDLALAGARVHARIVTVRPSHRGTVRLVRAMRDALKKETTVIGIDDIMKVLPHRYPFLLVDRILEFEPRKRIVGLKNVTINEPFFQGHFPGHPIMPGVLIIEAMAQVGGVLLMGAMPDLENKVVYFTSLDSVKWRRPVRPGDQLRFELEMIQIRGMMCKMKGVAKVEGETVAEAEMGAMVRDL
jgi:UDP-3-O-[3-hydroxymyristoyl] N-acetylglucosamine deacetylase / 3-hydroxyacyl-[acyl-carrier-protein] dehydratase